MVGHKGCRHSRQADNPSSQQVIAFHHIRLHHNQNRKLGVKGWNLGRIRWLIKLFPSLHTDIVRLNRQDLLVV